jgi:hypothetical protein
MARDETVLFYSQDDAERRRQLVKSFGRDRVRCRRSPGTGVGMAVSAALAGYRAPS